jgi:hypothetical protein
MGAGVGSVGASVTIGASVISKVGSLVGSRVTSPPAPAPPASWDESTQAVAKMTIIVIAKIFKIK